MDLGIFAMLFDGIGPPILGASNAMVAALQGWLRPILIAGVALYAIGKLIWDTMRGNGQPIGDALGIMISGSIFVYAATEAAGLGPQARDLLLNGISNEIGSRILSTISARPLGANLFDDAVGRAWAGGLEVYNKLPTFSLKAWALATVVVAYWIFAFICVAVAFFIWLTAFVMVALLVGFWPLGVGLFAFPWTRRLAWGWLSATLSNVLLQILIVAVLATILGAILRIMDRVALNLENEVANVGRLIAIGAVFGLLWWVAKQLPGLAATWAHGFTGFGQTAITNWSPSSKPDTAPGETTQRGTTEGAPQVTPNTSPMPQSEPPGRALG